MHLSKSFIAFTLPAKLLSILVVVVLLGNLAGVINRITYGNLYVLRHLNASYDDKMKEKVGTVFYNFTQFIVKNTPENAYLLIPPQAFPWPQTGNGAFMRYFVYPRDVAIAGEYAFDRDDVELKDFDYVLLAWGEGDVKDQHTHGWPKFDVPAEKVIFMNEDGSFAGETVGDYIYERYKGNNVWGLIKVKK